MQYCKILSFNTEEEKIMYDILKSCGYNPILDEEIFLDIDGKRTSIRPDFTIRQCGNPDIIVEVTTAFKSGYGRGHGNRTKIKITKRKRISELIRRGMNIVIIDIRCLVAIFTEYNIPFTHTMNQQVSLYPHKFKNGNVILPNFALDMVNILKKL